VLGPAKGEGNKMSQWLLKANGKAAPGSTRHSATELKKRAMFDGLIERRWGTSINPKLIDAENLDDKEFKEHENKDKPKMTAPNIEDAVGATVANSLSSSRHATRPYVLKCLSSWDRA
jgi:hypothetical protein